RKFDGKYPGTRTIDGYAAEFEAWAELNGLEESRTKTLVYSTRNIPEPPLEKLVQRYERLQALKGHSWGMSQEQKQKDLEELIGIGFNSQATREDPSLQIVDILMLLNNPEIFVDIHNTNGDIGFLLMGSFYGVLLQVLV